MKNCVITFRSITPAQRAEQVLGRSGYTCTIQRTPRWMQEQGCGYSLRIACRDVLPAAAVLQQQEIPFRKIYLRRENGKMEEMTL